ncbi:D-galactonate dehydratase family protein [Galbibacter sp. BG1]|uniref:D-mannonate dehydratase ManD n=1 Tax=Galbibacter sp. BG1 TaxID=1170699 RepID=UPI0015BB904B|nr:D-mannonate dehydratase ManD [Galbibacter sp. BG1]QLE02207.1 D-galactonate dehydratase family protein [Galbibacter sp. BG1]
MKRDIIESAEVIVCSPGRNFVTVKITTKAGYIGYGDATLNGRELAVAAYLEHYLCPLLEGRSVFQTEDIWNYFYKGAYWRKGPVTMTAIGAIDMALWDLKGKILETPVYNLLGGKSRSKMLTYTHANGKNLEDTLKRVEELKKASFEAIRVQCGIPGIEKAYGIGEKGIYEPAIKGNKPFEESWSTPKYLNFIPSVFEEVRKEFGEDLHLLHDSHHRLTPTEAARLAKDLEPYHLFWLEDVTPAEHQESFAQIKQKSVTPLAVGEVFNTIHDAHHLISNQSIDYIRMTVSHGGGITPMLKIAHFAEPYHIKTGCHGPSDISPIALAACLHVDTAINNFGIQEYMGYSETTEEAFPHEYYFENGHLHLTEAPGLGVDFNETFARKFEYEKAYLPINRLEDGTMFNW